MAPATQCNGCGRSFPNKDSAGLCRKCTLLSTLSDGTDEYKGTMAYPQCKGCGGTWKHFQGQICDECVDKENIVPNLQQASGPSLITLSTQAIESAKIARAHSMDVRLHKRKVNVLNTTEGLVHARASSMNTATLDKINIHFEVRVKDVLKRSSQTTDPAYGKWGRPWGKDEYLSEVLDDCLSTVNLIWEKDRAISLIREEVDFRFSPNRVFRHGTKNATVGETYTYYMTGDLANFYQPTGATMKGVNTKAQNMFLEVYIDKIMFDKRAQEIEGPISDEEPGVKIRTRKRSLDSSVLESELLDLTTVLRKKHRTVVSADYSQLSSRFVRSTLPKRGVSNEIFSTIKFIRADAGYISDTSDVEIVWPEAGEGSLFHSALLCNTAYAEGTTKKVYKLVIASSLFVAKRFFEAGSGTVTAQDNTEFLTQELVRLKQGQWFWSQFHILAKDKSMDICQDIEMSDGFLIREQGISSVASQDPSGLDSATWLIEPRQTTSVIEFSGTLQHPLRHDKIGKTITVFAHFVYEVSKKTLVFADIQGSPMSINNRDGVVLFDLMTHSIDGSSGVGDHGQAGIETFSEQHKCDFLCLGLDLPPINMGEDSDGEAN